MSVIAPCMTWVPILWGHILGLFTQNRRVPSYQEKETNTTVTAYQEKEKNTNVYAYQEKEKNTSVSAYQEKEKEKNTSVPTYQEKVKNITVEKCCRKKEKHTTLLPDDIIIAIFSRVPAECVFRCQRVCTSLRALTSTPSFVEMHLSQTKPGLLIYSYCWNSTTINEQYDPERTIEFCFFDDHWGAQKIEEARMKVNLSLAGLRCRYLEDPLGSYNGLLMFHTRLMKNIFFICNPVTTEQVAVILPSPDYVVCGLFLHSMTREYRLLCMYRRQACFGFIILSLGTKCSRPITTFSHPPLSKSRPPTIINGVLYWVVDEDAYRSVFGVYPPCSDSIVSFNTETEDFRMIPSPPGADADREDNKCCGRRCQGFKAHRMQLMELEGHLCLCLSFVNWCRWVTEIWVLEEDYIKRQQQQQEIWVKMHTIVYDKLYSPALCIQDGEILLAARKQLYGYHLQLCTLRKIYELDTSGVFLAPHSNSLVSFCTDNRVYLQHHQEAE